MCKRAWYIKCRATNCAPKNNEEKSTAVFLPVTCNQTSSTSIVVFNTNIKKHRISTFIKFQHNCEIGRRQIICAPRIFDDFCVQIFQFLSNYTYFLADPENRHKNYDFSKFPIFPEFSNILKKRSTKYFKQQNFYILSQHLLSGHQYFARQPGFSLSTVY